MEKYKSRVIARGYKQKYDIDYSETFSLVVKSQKVYVIHTLALTLGWVLKQHDVNTDCLNRALKKDVYMYQVQHFKDPKTLGFVCKLNKAIYSLKHAPRV